MLIRAYSRSMPDSTRIRHLATQHVPRLARFGLVGLSGVLINSAVLYLLVEGGRLNHLFAAALASEVSILSNFALNDHWTFRDARPDSSWAYRAAQYNAVALGGMVISVAVLALLTLSLGMHYMIANLIAIGFATVSNYTLNTRFTWTMPASREPIAVSN